MSEEPPPYRRGEFVVIYCGAPARKLDGMIGLASPNGESLIVFFDGILDSCVGAIPLFLGSDDVYRNVMTGHAIGLARKGRPT